MWLLPRRRPSLLYASLVWLIFPQRGSNKHLLSFRSFLLSLPPLVPLSLSQLMGESLVHHVLCCSSASRPGHPTGQVSSEGHAKSSGPSWVLQLRCHFASTVPSSVSPAKSRSKSTLCLLQSEFSPLQRRLAQRWSSHVHPAHQSLEAQARPCCPCNCHRWPCSPPSLPSYPLCTPHGEGGGGYCPHHTRTVPQCPLLLSTWSSVVPGCAQCLTPGPSRELLVFVESWAPG